MLVLLSVIIAYFRATCASQTYLNIPNLQNNGGGTPSFSRIDDIRSISTTNHTTLWHPSYPNYSVRIKQDGGKFCDDTVKSYTGYLDIEARHLFFMFFESRNNPKKDDVLLWANGGPGCSSSTGLFVELGPCRITDENNTIFNPHSWTNKANIIFIDQPIGAGYSYAEYGENVSTSEDAAKDVAAFMRIFFDTFSEFKGRPFHLAGESYAGRMLPVCGAAILDDNSQATSSGLAPVNLTSVMLGNGCGDNGRMIPSYYDFQCTAVTGFRPIQEISACVRMKKALPRCKRLLKESCIDIFDHMACTTAYQFCWTEIAGPFLATERNVYDISTRCSYEEYEKNMCYPLIPLVEKFLDRPDIRALIGADPAVPSYRSCNPAVIASFDKAIEYFKHPTEFYAAQLLERGVRMLVYVGANDFICNWVGNERYTLAIDWSGQSEFNSQPLREWFLDGESVGKTRSAKGLAFATIYGAGHFAPFDKPIPAAELLGRWLDGKKL